MTICTKTSPETHPFCIGIPTARQWLGIQTMAVCWVIPSPSIKQPLKGKHAEMDVTMNPGRASGLLAEMKNGWVGEWVGRWVGE